MGGFRMFEDGAYCKVLIEVLQSRQPAVGLVRKAPQEICDALGHQRLGECHTPLSRPSLFREYALKGGPNLRVRR